MSRAFVKEDDSGQPPIIPPRAALPPGTPNYVTPYGLSQLRAELAALEAEKAKLDANHTDEAERTRQLSICNGRLSALTARLASAKVVVPGTQPPDEVRFGATVTLRSRSGSGPSKERVFMIVGVDEADVAEGKVAFVAPIARTVTGKKLGQTVTLHMGRREEVAEIVAISYLRTASEGAES